MEKRERKVWRGRLLRLIPCMSTWQELISLLKSTWQKLIWRPSGMSVLEQQHSMFGWGFEVILFLHRVFLFEISWKLEELLNKASMKWIFLLVQYNLLVHVVFISVDSETYRELLFNNPHFNWTLLTSRLNCCLLLRRFDFSRKTEAGELEVRETGNEHARDHGKEKRERRNDVSRLFPFPWSFARALVPRKKERRLGTRQGPMSVQPRGVLRPFSRYPEGLRSVCAND